MTNYNQRYAFVTTHPLDARRGGMRAHALLALMEALSRRGKQVGLVTPSVAPPLGLSARWWFNFHLPRTLAPLVADAVIGTDGDGYRFAPMTRSLRFVAYLLGNQADARSQKPTTRSRPRRLQVAWEARAARTADLVVTTSKYLARRVELRYGVSSDRIAIVPLGVDSDRWPYAPLDGSEPPVVLVLGGADTNLPRLWDRVLAEYPNVHLSVAEVETASARSLTRTPTGSPASRILSATRAQGIEAIREAIRSASIVYVSDRAEHQGLSPLEAMATGRAIVAARAGSTAEIVGDAGVLVPPGDSEHLIRVLIELLGAPEECRRLGLRARKRAQKRSWAVAAQQFGAALAEL